jgi:hypothetical protein
MLIETVRQADRVGRAPAHHSGAMREHVVVGSSAGVIFGSALM